MKKREIKPYDFSKCEYEHSDKFIIDRHGNIWKEAILLCHLSDMDMLRRTQIHLFHFHKKYMEIHKNGMETIYLHNHLI